MFRRKDNKRDSGEKEDESGVFRGKKENRRRMFRGKRGCVRNF